MIIFLNTIPPKGLAHQNRTFEFAVHGNQIGAKLYIWNILRYFRKYF